MLSPILNELASLSKHKHPIIARVLAVRVGAPWFDSAHHDNACHQGQTNLVGSFRSDGLRKRVKAESEIQ